MTARHVTAPPGGWAPPWPLVVEVAAALPVGSWIHVGGLMVQLHAQALADWLLRLPPMLDEATIAAVFEVARRSTTWGQKS